MPLRAFITLGANEALCHNGCLLSSWGLPLEVALPSLAIAPLLYLILSETVHYGVRVYPQITINRLTSDS